LSEVIAKVARCFIGLVGLAGALGCSTPSPPPTDAAPPPPASTPVSPPTATSSAAPAPEVEAYPPLAPLQRALSTGTLDPHAQPQVHFSSDGQRLLVCCSRAAPPAGGAAPQASTWWIHIWDLAQGKLAGNIAYTSEIPSLEIAPFVDWSPGGRFIVVYDMVRLRLFRSPPGAGAPTLRQPLGAGAPPLRQPLGGEAPTLRPPLGGEAPTLKQERDVLADYGVHSIDPSDQRLVWSHTNEDAFLMDLANGKTLARRVTHNAATGLLVDLDWSPTGAHALVDGLIWRQNGAAAGNWEKLMGERWPGDVPLGWAWTRPPLGDEVPTLRAAPAGGRSPDAAQLLVATGGRLTAIELSSGRVAWSVDGVEPPIALDPTGNHLVYTTPSGSIGMLALADQKPAATFTEDPGPPDSQRDPTRHHEDAVRFSDDGARFVVQRTFEPLRVCSVPDHTCARLPWTTAQNAPPPVFRGADLYAQASSAFVAWSPDASRRWRLDKPERAGLDVSRDGRYLAAAVPGAVALLRLSDRRAVVLSTRFTGGAWASSLSPDEADVVRP